MSEEFDLKQQGRPAVLIKLATEQDVQIYLTELEVDDQLQEVVLQVFDATLQNFIAKRISLNIHATETPFA